MKLKLSPTKNCKPKTNRIKVPDGFVLLIDTKEQKPLFVKHRYHRDDPKPPEPKEEYEGIPMEFYDISGRKKDGWEGDYTIKGFGSLFGVERKMSSDFFLYIGRERQKTVRKLNRLSNMDYALLCIEGLNIDDLAFQQDRTKIQPSHVSGFLKSIEMWGENPNGKNGIHHIEHRSRKFIEKWVMDRCIYYYKKKKGL